MVRNVVNDLDFDSPQMGPNWMREFYRDLRAYGQPVAFQRLHERAVIQRSRPIKLAASAIATDVTGSHDLPAAPEPDDECIDPQGVSRHLGDRIFKRCGDGALAPYLPFGAFSVVPYGNSLLLRFRPCCVNAIRMDTLTTHGVAPRSRSAVGNGLSRFPIMRFVRCASDARRDA